MLETNESPVSPFSSHVEASTRLLVLLSEASPRGCSLDRLVIYDYLLVHSEDVLVDDAHQLSAPIVRPPSLHPPTPHRAGELLVRRKSLFSGLQLLIIKGLARPDFGDDGISYMATTLCEPFLEILKSDYTRAIRARAMWVISLFERLPEGALSAIINDQLREWGSEFARESLLHWRAP